MRVPLLVAARPKFSKGGGCVPLMSGKWHIVAERVKDTILAMHVNDVLLLSHLAAGNDGHVVEGPCLMMITFVQRGTEDYVHAYAELIT